MAARQRRKFGPSRKERISFGCTPDEKTAAIVRALAENIKLSKSFQANLILPEHLHVTYFIFATGQGCRKRLSISRVVPHPESMSLPLMSFSAAQEVFGIRQVSIPSSSPRMLGSRYRY